MAHERGAVPGPTTKEGDRPDNSAQPGERAAEQQASPPPPLGYGEGASETLGTTNAVPDPKPGTSYHPSEGESATRTSAPPRGGGYILIPGEDS